MTEGGLVLPTTLQQGLVTGGGGDSGAAAFDVLVNMADNRSRAAVTAGD